MNSRITAASLLSLSLILVGGCASGPGGAEGGAAPQAFDEENLPEWVLALPEGVEPRDNEHTDLAVFHLLQGNNEIALEAAMAGIEADPENPQSYFQAGEAHLRLGDYETAAQMFDQAEEIYPRYVVETDFMREEAWIEAYNESVTFLQEDDTESAIEWAARAHTIYQGRPEAAVLLASLYQQVGQIDEAIDAFGAAAQVRHNPRFESMEDEEVLASWRDDVEVALFNQGQLLFQAGRYAEAAEVYEELMELFPDDPGVVSSLAASLVSAGEVERASEIYDELLARDDLSATDYILIGSGLFEADQLEGAAVAFGAAHEMVPWDRDTLLNYAQALYFGEMFPELLDPAERLVEMDPYNANAYRFLAQALVRDDRQDEAVENLEEMEALPFHIEGMHMAALDGGVAVVGGFLNRNADPNTSVELTADFYDGDGAVIGSESITVNLGAPDEVTPFQLDFPTTAEVMGYQYQATH